MRNFIDRNLRSKLDFWEQVCYNNRAWLGSGVFGVVQMHLNYFYLSAILKFSGERKIRCQIERRLGKNTKDKEK